MARRIMKDFKINEISAVDRPAQSHARMAIMKRAETTTGNKGDPDMSAELQKRLDELTAQVGTLTKSLETSTSELAIAQAVSKMSDKDKEYMEGLKDEDAKKAFRDLSADERSKRVNKAAEADEVLKVDGTEIRKSAVGEAQFLVMKSQQDRIAKQDEEIAKERDARVMSDLKKRADDEYSHVPGTVDERASMLKAMQTMSEPVRKSFEAVFTQSERLAKTAFDTLGNRNDPVIAKRGEDFMAKVAEIEKTEKLSSTEALRKARQIDPEGFKAYQGETATA